MTGCDKGVVSARPLDVVSSADQRYCDLTLRVAQRGWPGESGFGEDAVDPDLHNKVPDIRPQFIAGDELDFCSGRGLHPSTRGLLDQWTSRAFPSRLEDRQRRRKLDFLATVKQVFQVRDGT